MEQKQDTLRFRFPGFIFLRNKDNSTHEVDVGTLEVKGVKYTLDMIRSRKTEGRGDFLPASVKKDGMEVWRFKDEGFKGIAILIETAPSNPVICLISGTGKGRRVERVVSFSGLSRLQRVNIHGITTLVNPDEDIGETIKTKCLVAKKLGSEVVFSKNEEVLIAYGRNQEKKRQEDEKNRVEAKRKGDAEKQRKRVTAIMFRKKIVGFTADGKPRSGIPVTKNEYQCLPNGMPVILVESYNQTTCAHAGLSEAFRIGKTPGGRVSKVHSTPITEINPVTKTTSETVPEAARIFLIEHEHSTKNVLVFVSQDEIRVARERGLNGGTFVTAETTRQKDGRFEIYQVRTDGMQTIGYFNPLE